MKFVKPFVVPGIGDGNGLLNQRGAQEVDPDWGKGKAEKKHIISSKSCHLTSSAFS